MTFLGIDYGRSKLGLAIAYGSLAEPLVVLKSEELEKIKEIVKKEKVEKIIVGVSDGEMGKESRDFGLKLSQELGLPVDFQDENLSSIDAQRFAIEAGIKRSKRKALEDSYAAAVMLQNYLDNHS
ncbi:MAG: Holliday junction resolvase RuvX [Patescibacteria group bacterium]